MYKSIKEQRQQFIQSLRENVSIYKSHISSNETSKAKLDAEKIKQDWQNVGNSFPICEK